MRKIIKPILLFAIVNFIWSGFVSNVSAEEIESQDNKKLTKSDNQPKYLLVTYVGATTQKKNAELITAFQGAIAEGRNHAIITFESTGGDTTSSMAAYEAIRALPIQVTTFAAGQVMSAAISLYCIGSKRYSSDSSIFLIHPNENSGSVFGIDQAEQKLRYLKKLDGFIQKIYTD